MKAAKAAVSAIAGASGSAAGKVTDNALKGQNLTNGLAVSTVMGAGAGTIVGAKSPVKRDAFLGTPKQMAEKSMKSSTATIIIKEVAEVVVDNLTREGIETGIDYVTEENEVDGITGAAP